MLHKLKSDIVILWKFDKKYFDKAKVIIPYGIDAQKNLNKYPKYKHKFLINKESIYNNLDDKIDFYKIVRQHNLLQNSNVKFINTYDNRYSGPNINKKFIVKHRNGYGSNDNKIISGNIYDIINKYSKDHQIQDILDIKNIHSISCLCKDGKIVSSLNFMSSAFIQSNFYDSKQIQYIKSIDENFMTTMSNIISHFNYNGFVEFEFIEDIYGDNYLMESNPRISGTISITTTTKNTITKNEDAPFINNMIIPYCNLVMGSNVNLFNYPDNYETIYHGDIVIPKYEKCNCGCIHFSNYPAYNF